MTDVRLTATTTDGVVVPVLSNTKGELLLEAPIAPPEFDGNLNGDLNVSGVSIVDGNGQFGENPFGDFGDAGVALNNTGGVISCADSEYVFIGKDTKIQKPTSIIESNGNAEFQGDVVIGSKGSLWLIRESNGVAMLIEQTFTKEAPEKVRDLPRELDLIEAALNEVMDKLKMTPPAGWEVWDGSDNSQ